MTTEAIDNTDSYSYIGLPKLGFRNYWHPALAAWRLGRKPKAVHMLGEDIVLFRDGNKLFALHDRCAHRGAKLSMGKCLYGDSGTISCPYHGWTYKGETGQVIAKLVEGPNANIPAKARVKTYPVRELRGAIWVFIGDMPAVPPEEDLPVYLANKKEWRAIWNWRTYRCDWRFLSDNLSHDQHAPYLHRTSPELLFKPIFPHATTNAAIPLPDGKSLGHRAADGVTSAAYPSLGRFPPKEEWYRMLSATGRAQRSSELPGVGETRHPSSPHFDATDHQSHRLPERRFFYLRLDRAGGYLDHATVQLQAVPQARRIECNRSLDRLDLLALVGARLAILRPRQMDRREGYTWTGATLPHRHQRLRLAAFCSRRCTQASVPSAHCRPRISKLCRRVTAPLFFFPRDSAMKPLLHSIASILSALAPVPGIATNAAINRCSGYNPTPIGVIHWL